jgi:hypothetical protein
MARVSSRAQQFTSRGYKDFNLTFKSNPVTGDFSSLKNDEAIKQAVRNFNPFTSEALADEITLCLLNNEPRIVVTNIDIDDDKYDLNALSVTVEYQIVGQPILKNFSFLLTKA